MKKKALITGVTGQDGSYLADYLIKKNYEVWGMVRRSSSFNRARIEHLYLNKKNGNNFKMVYGDLSDSSNISGTIYDLGCGEKPFQNYFESLGVNYIGVDWSNSLHNLKADIIADLNKSLPIESNSLIIIFFIEYKNVFDFRFGFLLF